MEHELLSLRSDSWTEVQLPNPCTSVLQGSVEHVSLPTVDPMEDFSEEDMATGSMAVAGRSPNKHTRTGTEEDSVDIAALLDRAADRFSACMDTKVDSMMDPLEKRVDEKIDSKLGPEMDRLWVLQKTSISTRSDPLHSLTMVVLQVRAVVLEVHLKYLILTWKSRIGVDFVTQTNKQGPTEAQAREIIAELRQGIVPDLDSLMARVRATRVRNTKMIFYLRTPILSSCKQIREAMNAFIEKENIKLGAQGTTLFVTEEQQKTFGKALGVTEQLATMMAKYITSQWCPFYQVYVHASESAKPTHLLTTTSGALAATDKKQNCWGSQQINWLWLIGEVLSDEAEEYARLKFARWQWSHIIFSSEELLKQGT